jgi:phosphoribosylglycinamide formyltransferase-1
MNLCLLTYDRPHLKTSQVVNGLHKRGILVVDFLLTPFAQRADRNVLCQHRPQQFAGPTPHEIAAFSGGSVYPYRDWPALLDRYDYFLVCGANLIEAEFANSGKILNVHAGLIPAVRGLDAFKWAILRAQPLGNTLHRIDAETDAGEVLAHMPTPVFIDDSLETLAARHYANEIWMLANFQRIMAVGEKHPSLVPAAPTKRMSVSVEGEMIGSFTAYIAQYAIGKSHSLKRRRIN